MDEERGSDDVGLDDAMFRVIRIIGDVEGSCGVVNAKEWPADTMTEQPRRAVMEAASGVMNNMVAAVNGSDKNYEIENESRRRTVRRRRRSLVASRANVSHVACRMFVPMFAFACFLPVLIFPSERI